WIRVVCCSQCLDKNAGEELKRSGSGVWQHLVPSAGLNLIRFYGFGRTDLSLRMFMMNTKAPRQVGSTYLGDAPAAIDKTVRAGLFPRDTAAHPRRAGQ